MPGLMYGCETMLWKKKERSRVRTVQNHKLKGLLGIRRLDRVSNARIRELCGVKKGLNERIEDGVLLCFGDGERNRIAKKVYVGECAGSHPVGRPRKRSIDTAKECLKKRDLDIRQARRMVQDRSEWWGACEGECMGRSLGVEPLTLTRYRSCGLPQLYEALKV